MLFRNNRKQRTTDVAVTALAILALAPAANAQFSAIGTPFNAAGPTIGTPIGGGVLRNIGFGTGLNTGFGSFNTGFNSGFTLPLNTNFNSQLAAFNLQRANASTLLDFNSRLSQFNANRTATATQFSNFNSALNVPAANFETPNPTLFPATQNLLANTFTQVNPSLNPLIVNGPVPGSVGFSSFNTLNALNPSATGFQTFNTLANSFGGAGVPATAQIQNVTHISRAKPAYNPTLPNPAVSAYPTATMLANSANTQISQSPFVTTSVGSQINYQPATSPYWATAARTGSTTTSVGSQINYQPVTTPYWTVAQTGSVTTSVGSRINYQPMTSPYWTTPPRMGLPVIGGPPIAFGPGAGTGATVMGARSFRR